MRRYACVFLIPFAITYTYTQSLDATFGDNGIVITDIEDSDHLYNLLLQSDQKIIASAMQGGHPWFGGTERMAVVRYLPDGSLDPGFGDNGVASIRFNYYWQQLYNIALQQDGRIVLGGNVSYERTETKEIVEDLAMTRLNTDGSLDTTFGNGGLVVTDLGTEIEIVNEVLVQEDGKIIAAGRSTHGYVGSFAGFVMVRYESNGVVDSSFGIKGVVQTDIREFVDMTGAVIQPDGKIILSGYVHEEGFLRDFIMARYNSDGTIDSLFGNNGIVQTDLDGQNKMDLATSILLDPDGKIVLGGYANFTYMPAQTDIGVVRYQSNGRLDSSFVNNGVSVIQFGDRSRLQAMARQSDGKYLLTGASNLTDTVQQWFIIRLKSDGQLDSTFGGSGIFLTDIEGENEFAAALVIQADGKIVVGGVKNGLDYQDLALARYNVDKETGIQPITALSIIISPNPCTDFLTVYIDASGPLNCMITELSGRVFWQQVVYTDTADAIQFDVQKLHAGYYMLGIINNGKSGVV